jgi:putative peptide zinc metalloprotease protein
VIALVLAGLVAVDAWYFFVHGVAQSTRELVYNPILLLMVLGLVVVATALHEIGHATAARYGGAKPGVMGAGIYIVWPAFYTDVTDAYRLDRRGRLRTDLGGVYFNVLFILAITGVYFLTRFEPLLVLIIVQHMQILQQFLPFLRLDGYYILSDLTGVPDLFARLKPTLKSMLPGQEEDKRAAELKPWVRIVVTAWVLALVPILLLVFGLMIFNAPRMFATAWDSFFLHLDQASGAFGEGKALSGVASGVQMVTLALPAAGISASLGRGGKHMFTGAWSWSQDSALRRGAVVLLTAGLVGLTAFIWWPNGDYRPIQPGERGTVQSAVGQFAEIDTGRPGFTEEYEQEIGEAPFVSDDGTAPVEEDEAPNDAGTPADDGSSTGTTDGTASTSTASDEATEPTETNDPTSSETAPATTTQTETAPTATTQIETAPATTTQTETAPTATTAATP